MHVITRLSLKLGSVVLLAVVGLFRAGIFAATQVQQDLLPNISFPLYDFAKAAERIRVTQYPQAESYAAGNVLQPPSETEMLERFTRAGLR